MGKGWKGTREVKKKKYISFVTYLGRQVKDQGLHYLEKLTNRLALGVNIFQRRGPLLLKRSTLFPGSQLEA